jgi:uncharacterized protein
MKIVWLLMFAMFVATLGFQNQESKPPEIDFDQYQFGMLKRGPNYTSEKTAETEKIQAGHMANIEKMAKSGKLVAAGPMGGDGPMRGIFIFHGTTIDEAKKMADEDPAIQSGRLVLEVLPWMAPRGIGKAFGEAYRKDPSIKMTMTMYYLGLVTSGPKVGDRNSPEGKRLFLEHLWDLRRQLDAKNYASAGPITGGGTPLRGLFVIAAKSAEDAKTIVSANPMVKAEWASVEILPWYVAKEVWP